MASDLFYPPLDIKTLQNLEIARQLMAEHPSYFLDCPYEGATELLMKKWFDPSALRGRKLDAERAEDASKPQISMEQDKWQYLYQETSDLYKGLKNEKYASEEGDRVTYYKTMAALQEKLINLQERALGMKQISEHNKLVMNIMENVLSPTQRNEFMAKLQESLGGA